MQSLLDWFRLAGYPVMESHFAAQVRARNSDEGSLASSVPNERMWLKIRLNPNVNWLIVCRREHVRLGKNRVPSVIVDVLVLPKAFCLGPIRANRRV